jgi:hypothetical protein
VAKNRVTASGGHVKQQSDGRYALQFWYRLEGGRFHEEIVIDLSWTEAGDCLLTQLDACRPGWEVGDGWRQPSLEDDLEWLSGLG